MFGRMRKMLCRQQGFTLVELMTVLIILGIILGIGVPKYLKIQAQSEYDADVVTIKNIAKAAEIYMVQNQKNKVYIAELKDKGVIDKNHAFNRKLDTSDGYSSIKNVNPTKTVNDYYNICFHLDPDTGEFVEYYVEEAIYLILGYPPIPD